MRFINLIFACIPFLVACTNPTPIPPTETPTPTATETPTSTVVATISAVNPHSTIESLISPIEDLSITIQKFETFSDGYILYGSYEWVGASEINFVYLDDVLIQDANGYSIPYEHANPASVVNPGEKSLPFAFKIASIDNAFPLLISVQSVDVLLPTTVTFQFDVGANPQVGDEWTPNIDVPFENLQFTIQKVKLITGQAPTEFGFTFTIKTPPNVTSLFVTDVNFTGIASGGGGGGGDFQPYILESSWAYEGYSPAGIKTFQISNITMKVFGNWQTTWQP